MLHIHFTRKQVIMLDKMENQNDLIEGKWFDIQIYEDEYWQISSYKGVSIWLDKDEMKDFLETMTDEENQKKMKEELGKIRLINDVEKQMRESIR